MRRLPILLELDDRRAVLAYRLANVLAADERGDSGSTWIELDLLCDEMEFLVGLYRAVRAEYVRA